MRAVQYRLTLREPLLATSLQGDPNSSVSLGYVPGSLVRGALIQQYVRKYNLEGKLESHAEAQRLFFAGGVRYLHANPCSFSDTRSLPTPRSLIRRKHDSFDSQDVQHIEVRDAGHPDYNQNERTDFSRGEAIKPLGAPFCTIEDDTVSTYKPNRTIAVHIQRNVVYGRSLRGNGEVFRYDALAPEQEFIGMVLVDDDSDAAVIKSLLTEWDTCWLGRSRSAHYGKTNISDVQIVEDWREYHQPNAPQGEALKTNRHSLTFLSDTLLRNTDGSPASLITGQVLAAYLGVTGTAVIDEDHTFSALTAVGGFNRTWQLPLTQDYAIAAGSVVSFTGIISQQQAKLIEQQGIGMRRTEGFGRVAIDWRGNLKLQATKGKPREQAMSLVQPLAAQSQRLASRMARLLEQTRAERAIVEFANKTPINGMQRRSQLGRVRVFVRRALPNGNTDYVRQQLQTFKSASRTQFERARIDNQRLYDWMLHLLEQPNTVWTQLGIAEPQPFAGQTAARNDRQTALQLLAAVLSSHARKLDAEGSQE